MTIAHRAATRRRAAALAASLALAAGMVGTLAAPVAAEEPTTAHFVDHSPVNWDLYGQFPGHNPGPQHQAGLNILDIAGEDADGLAYCVDPSSPINGAAQGGYDLDEANWDTSGVNNADIVTAILTNYFPIAEGPEGYTLTGSDAEKAGAVQAAIWHFIGGFELFDHDPTGNVKNLDTAFADYNVILKAVADGVLETPAKLTLTVDQPDHDDAAVPNTLVGPFVVHTTAASVDLLPDDGLVVSHEDGTPFTGPAHDGDELWLTSASDGKLSLTIKAQGLESGVRFFTNDTLQDFSFAVVTPAEKEVKVEVEFTTPPQTTTPSTAPPTTAPATTVPVTPETSVVTTVPDATTVPVTPSQGGLPVTGAQSALLAGIALVLIGVGVTFGIISRRRRGEA
ncbi:MAG TPA: thioester domain-containing protein [Acidimicrobiales bacterium]|nr:thioester domain-containing protein [Acidimicrobiales bacterium]